MTPATAWWLMATLLNAGAFFAILWLAEQQRRERNAKPVDVIFVDPEDERA